MSELMRIELSRLTERNTAVLLYDSSARGILRRAAVVCGGRARGRAPLGGPARVPYSYRCSVTYGFKS